MASSMILCSRLLGKTPWRLPASCGDPQTAEYSVASAAAPRASAISSREGDGGVALGASLLHKVGFGLIHYMSQVVTRQV